MRRVALVSGASSSSWNGSFEDLRLKVCCFLLMIWWKEGLEYSEHNNHLSKPKGDQDSPNNGGLLDSTILAAPFEICNT